MFAYGQAPHNRSRAAWACSFVLHIIGAASLATFGGAIMAPPAHRTGATLVFIPPPPVEQAPEPAPLPKPKLRVSRIPKLPQPVETARKPALIEAPVLQPAPERAAAKPLSPAIETEPPPPPPQVRTGVLDAPRQAAAPQPRPAQGVQTGLFAQQQPAAVTRTPKLAAQPSGFDSQAAPNQRPTAAAVTAKAAGFGAVVNTQTHHAQQPVHAAMTGAFGSAATTQGSGTRRVAVVSGSAFGSASTETAGPARAYTQTARAGFGDAIAAKPAASVPASAAAPTSRATPVEITSKPRPTYTAEARQLQIEGEVVIQVVFTASGHVEILRIIRGLGHGLNETAVAAARGIRFKPATRNGAPVDSAATVRMNFELAY